MVKKHAPWGGVSEAVVKMDFGCFPCLTLAELRDRDRMDSGNG
jgi:hypothetical protein